MNTSIFGRYGTGGRVPGDYKIPHDDNSAGFDFALAADGTDNGNPDTKPEIYLPDQAVNVDQSFGEGKTNKTAGRTLD